MNIFDLAEITTAVEGDGDDDNAGFGERVEDGGLVPGGCFVREAIVKRGLGVMIGRGVMCAVHPGVCRRSFMNVSGRLGCAYWRPLGVGMLQSTMGNPGRCFWIRVHQSASCWGKVSMISTCSRNMAARVAASA